MKKIFDIWKKIASAIGNFQFNLIFSFFYFVLIVPMGFLVSLVGDILRIKEKPVWQKMDDNAGSLEKIKKQ